MSAAAEPSRCPKCQGRKYVIEPRGDRAFATICFCARPCPRCGDLGFVYTTKEETISGKIGKRTYEVLVDCECQLRERRVRAYNDAHLPAASAHASFATFRGWTPHQDRALQVASAFAYTYSRTKPTRGFILSGPVGTGKTHLLAAALSHLLLESGVTAAYVEISLLYATIRRGFQEGKSGGEIIGPLSEVEVLAIDELGKGRGSAFELETMDELIARRYNAGRTTLFATNYSLAPEKKPLPNTTSARGYRTSADVKQAGAEPELLRERTSERIYSRLCEMCDFVELPAGTPDHRLVRHELR
ncbi:MAG: ATP-binding protein [Myxococcaceae bacterium]|nr:ATP-binding protein [Myxococcaceae bacterium]